MIKVQYNYQWTNDQIGHNISSFLNKSLLLFSYYYKFCFKSDISFVLIKKKHFFFTNLDFILKVLQFNLKIRPSYDHTILLMHFHKCLPFHFY
jgi:hypothetical protein